MAVFAIAQDARVGWKMPDSSTTALELLGPQARLSGRPIDDGTGQLWNVSGTSKFDVFAVAYDRSGSSVTIEHVVYFDRNGDLVAGVQNWDFKTSASSLASGGYAHRHSPEPISKTEYSGDRETILSLVANHAIF